MVDSEPDKGSTFRFILPVPEKTGEPAFAAPSAEVKPSSS
jgi:hypothetical protein